MQVTNTMFESRLKYKRLTMDAIVKKYNEQLSRRILILNVSYYTNTILSFVLFFLPSVMH